MSIQFDLAGKISIPEWVSGTGDFLIEIPSLGVPSDDGVFLGQESGSSNFMSFLINDTNEKIRMRLAGGGLNESQYNLIGSTEIFLRAERINGTLTIQIDSDTSFSVSNTDSFTVDRMSGYGSSNTLPYDGEISGVMLLERAGDNRSYDFDAGSEGDTVLTDSVSGQNGTLVGFTTGGFVDEVTLSITNNAFTLFQRDNSRMGEISVTGTYTGDVQGLERSLDGGATWSVINGTVASDAFIDTFTTIEGQYNVIYRVTNHTTVISTAQFQAVGDRYACLGQSNMMGRLENLQIFSNATNGITAYLFGNDDNWKQLSDPYDDPTNQVDSVSEDTLVLGSWIVRFAHNWLQNNQVPIGFIPCARGGSPISGWARSTDVSTLYGSMKRRIDAVGSIRAGIFQLGETDAANGTDGEVYRQALEQLALDFYNDFGVGLIVMPLHTVSNATPENQQAIRDAQIQAAANSPHITLCSPTTGIDISDGDGVHFQQDDEGQALADIAITTIQPFVDDIYTSTINLDFSAPNGGTVLPDSDYDVIFTDADNKLIEIKLVSFVNGLANNINVSRAVGTNVNYRIETSTHIAGGNGVTV